MLDISNICRICLKEEDPKLPIFTENDEKSESKPTLPEKIMSFARVKVVKDDGLPMYICVKCYCQVDTTVEFKRLCEESFHFFTRQLDSFSNQLPSSKSFGTKDNSDGYDSNSKKLPSRVDQSYKDAVSFTQHWVLPDESVKTEELDFSGDDEPTTQVFKITGNDESWIDSGEKLPCETEMEPQMIKCEPIWDYQSFDFDLSDVKIENGTSDEDGVNPLEINSNDTPLRENSPFDDMLTQTSNIERTCKCHSCEMVFSNRREMGFHISIAHRRCGTCGKYFFTNKDKDAHICSEVNLEEKSPASNRGERVGQCCHLCNKTVKQMKSHMAWHRKRNLKIPETESNSVEVVDQVDKILNRESENINKIKCHLCDAVCSNQRGFKVHITCMHRDHRIVYACLVCKSHQFFGRANYKRHMLKKHGLLASGNIQFELKHVAECEADDVKGMLKKKYKKKKSFNSTSDDMSMSNDYSKENKSGERTSRKHGLRMSHPPFSSEIPIISNNFEVFHDSNGEKIYVCRGCNVRYKRYISAYNHYYTLSKRAAKIETNQLVPEGKPYNCKFCTLKFASRSQAMMHRVHAHKYFHKKFTMDTKNKTDIDLTWIRSDSAEEPCNGGSAPNI